MLAVLMGYNRQPAKCYTHEVMNPMTPVKDQGEGNLCWVYAMLAAIETEHLRWGDSVNLSPAYIEKKLELEPQAPKSHRGMGATLIALIQKHGIVGYDAMRRADKPAPRFVFMLGAEYTPQEFARSVCAPDEYVHLTSIANKPYGQEIVFDEPDNWLRSRFLNIPIDTLLEKTIRAVRQHHGVCWESRQHAMAIVGLAHDEQGNKYFVMKNSWGTNRPYNGLEYLSFSQFKKQTLAVEMTREAFRGEQEWRLVWSDEFTDNGRPDPATWNFERGFVRNHEAQWYQEQNAWQQDGLLIIEARREQGRPNPTYQPDSHQWGRQRKTIDYTSACLTTQGKRTFLYGRLEVSARIPTASGAWPAIWTLGSGLPWPSCGEVDMMEFYRINGVPHILANAAWGNDELYQAVWNSRKVPFTHFTDRDPSWSQRFHLWRMDWD